MTKKVSKIADKNLHPFFRGESVHGNVVFNFLKPAIGQFEAFAAGYHEAGKVLVTNMKASRGYRDYDGYPILYLYRHALELYLKAFIYRGVRLLEIRDNQKLETGFLLTSHRLSSFLPAFRAILTSIDWKWDFEITGFNSLDDFEDLIIGIEKVDADSYCFRYPVTTKGDSALPKHFVVNVINFAKHMDKILDMLDGAIRGLKYEWNLTVEFEYIIKDFLKK